MNIRLPILGIDESIVQSVAVHAIKSIARQLELRPMHIETEAEAIGYKNGRWIIKGMNNEIFGPHNEFITTKIEEGLADTTVASSTPLQNVRDTLVEDEVAGLIARPWGTDSQMKLTSVYFTKSKTDADTLISRLRYLATIGQRLFPADLDYFYFPCEYFYEVINEVLKNKMLIMDDYDEVDDPFHTYLKEIIANGNTTFSWSAPLSLHHNKVYPIVRERQNVHLAITSDMLEARKEYDNVHGYWGVHFTVRLVYFKHQAIDMSYEISPYNNLLPEKYLPVENPGHTIHEEEVVIRHPQVSMYKHTENGRLLHTLKTNILYVPDMDVQHPKVSSTSHGMLIASILLDVNLNDMNEICNLNNLGDLAFTPEVLEFISTHKSEVLKMNDAPFCIKLMSGDNPASHTVLTLDDDLNLRTTVDLDPLTTYRLQVYYQTRGDKLTERGKEVFENTDLFKEYMPIIKYIVSPDDERYVPRDEYWYKTEPINYRDILTGSLLSIHANLKDKRCP